MKVYLLTHYLCYPSKPSNRNLSRTGSFIERTAWATCGTFKSDTHFAVVEVRKALCGWEEELQEAARKSLPGLSDRSGHPRRTASFGTGVTHHDGSVWPSDAQEVSLVPSAWEFHAATLHEVIWIYNFV